MKMKHGVANDLTPDRISPHLVPCKHCKLLKCVTAEFICEYFITQRWTDYYNRYIVDGEGNKVADNNEIRRFLYRQFLYVTSWAPLLRGVRNKLPACATMMIRYAYPSEGGVYVGFRNENGNESVAAVNAQEEDVSTHHWERDGTAWILRSDDDGSVDATIIPGEEMWMPGDPM